MPKQAILSAKAVAAIRTPGRHAIGGGAYLTVSDDGRRQYWARGQDAQGKRRWKVLGDADTLTLSEARATASQAIAVAAEAARPARHVRTFLEAANAFMAERQAAWKHKAHRAQWQHSIDIVPALHRLRVDNIGARDVAAALLPLQDRAETLLRTRCRIEAVISAELAGAEVFDRVNPADLKIQRHLVPGLAPNQRRKARKAVEHHPAMSLEAARTLWSAIPDKVPGRALRLLMLTAARTSEIRLARWRDWNPETRILVIPAENAKNGVPHEIPVPAAALPLLANARDPDAYIFSHARTGKHLSQDAMRMTLRRAGAKAGDATVHGFRSTFRDWCRAAAKDETLAELALGHTVGDEVVRAYARGTALERRRELMEDWATALTAPPTAGNVTPLRKVK